MKLSAFDLNHVRALHFLLEEAHVARAARRLAITPAAMSNALRRLRTELGDPLLVRVGRILVRTPLAEELRNPAREVIMAAERLLDTAIPFEPATFQGMFVLRAADRIAEILVQPIDALLSERAPLARLHVQTLGGMTGAVLPEQRSLFILPENLVKRDNLHSEALFVEPYVCVLRSGHPLLEGRWTLQRYADAEHILVAPQGKSARGLVDDALEARGLSRRVSRVVTSFTLAIALVRHSDRITTIPASFAAARGEDNKVVLRKPPLAISPNRMQLAWHPQQDGDPRYMWFRRIVHDAVRGLGLPTE